MSKVLYLLRRGKSDWSRPVSDFERPLKKRGKEESSRLGAWLRANCPLPERVVTSTARRARHTAELVCGAMELSEQLIESDEDLYMAGERELLGQVRQTDETVSCLMLVGHNPGMEDFLLDLMSGDDGVSGLPKILPTATVAAFDVDCAWEDIAPQYCSLRFIQRGLYS